jgi:hypothetical protein
LGSLGASAPVTYSLETAQAPSGLSLTGTGNNVVTYAGGSALTAGTVYSVVVKAVDAAGNVAFLNLSLHIN